jgi:tetratricopeptide (TPR) repeat protein
MPPSATQKRKATLPVAIRHSRCRGFIDALVRTEEGSRHWHRHIAGLNVLTLVDQAWHSRRRPASDTVRFIRVRRLVTAVEPATTRQLLDDILDVIVAGAAPDETVIEALTAYAIRLEREGWLDLARDVHQLIVDAARDSQLTSLLPQAYRRLGSCQRELGEWAAALRMYARATSAARRIGDIVAEQWVELARANLLRAQGRLDEARTTLDSVLARAKEWPDQSELLAKASHDRGTVAHLQNDGASALRYFASALQTWDDPDHIIRVMNDVGRTATAAGLRSLGRAAHLAVYKFTRDRYMRWTAVINMMYLAVVEGNRELFEQYRLELLRAPIGTQLLIAYHFQVGDGYARFGEPRLAQESWARVEQLGIRYGLKVVADEAADVRRAGVGRPDPLPLTMTDELRALEAELEHSLPALFGARRAPRVRGTIEPRVPFLVRENGRPALECRA